MPVRIFNNIASLNAQRILGQNNDRLAQSIERIASGIRINRGADDAAGLAISEALRSDIRALRQGIRNANDGISLINVTEGALNEQSGILIRLRELSSQAATGTVGSTERATIQLEFTALSKEINRISATTEFNGQKLIDGTLAQRHDRGDLPRRTNRVAGYFVVHMNSLPRVFTIITATYSKPSINRRVRARSCARRILFHPRVALAPRGTFC